MGEVLYGASKLVRHPVSVTERDKLAVPECPVVARSGEGRTRRRAVPTLRPVGVQPRRRRDTARYTESSIVKPLALTRGYAGDSALNRFMETARFWIDVSEPGGLDAGGPGRATAMRVRVMHVFIRRHIADHPEWRAEPWGVPISQSDALITPMSSSLTPGLAMHLMGIAPRAARSRH